MSPTFGDKKKFSFQYIYLGSVLAFILDMIQYILINCGVRNVFSHKLSDSLH